MVGWACVFIRTGPQETSAFLAKVWLMDVVARDPTRPISCATVSSLAGQSFYREISFSYT